MEFVECYDEQVHVLTERPVFPEEGERGQDVRRHGLVVQLQQRRQAVQHVLVQEVRGEHERQHHQQFQTALGCFLDVDTWVCRGVLIEMI